MNACFPGRWFLITLFGILLAGLGPISAGLAAPVDAVYPAQTLAAQASQQPGLLFIENVGQFVGDVRFQVCGAGGNTLWLADRLTYTLRLVWPRDGSPNLYDPLPPLSYTRYVSGSLNRPGLAYDAGTHAISGSLELTAGLPLTLSFAVQVRVAGTAGFAPVIANRACIYPEGEGVKDCQWSNLVVHYTYAWPIYLPAVM